MLNINYPDIIHYARNVILPNTPGMTYEEAIVEAYRINYEVIETPIETLERVFTEIDETFTNLPDGDPDLVEGIKDGLENLASAIHWFRGRI